ncbi:recombinase family protein [Alkaliphilus sp. B6464]|uniref:recombinase family protein n=1 Tax=Alkaliphilus sp. B6464 TaxID=2731219 RepID=UPI001BA7BD45|nr:recombinase family protein [Alkaliphilus sp. B6464]QUH20130.1 recombinase family protein [Alkaliphilus sp. B6464]
MKKIAIYARKSKFTGKGESIENQIEMCKDYVNKHLNNPEIILYEDEGFSGGNSDRPEFQNMIAAAEKGMFDILVCYRLDRISRSIVDFSNIMEILEENDIAFVSIREQFDTSTPMGRAMMFISSVFAQLERETIAERIKDNLMKLARTGRWLGGVAPTGYQGKREYYYDEKMQKKSSMMLVPVKDELDLVTTLYKKYIELDSLSGLMSWTLVNNIKSKNGKDFDMVALKTILTNTVYVKTDEYLYEWFDKQGYDIANEKKDYKGNGVFTYNKYQNRRNKSHKIKDISEQIVAIGKHKGIINSKDWVKVQEMLQANSKKAPRTGTGENGLIGPILYCECGSRMRIALKYTDGEVKHYYYKCRTKEESHSTRCNMKNLNGIKTDEIVENALKQLKFNKGVLADQLREKVVSIEKTSRSTISGSDKYISEIEKHEKSIENLTMQLSENQGSVASKYIIKQIEGLDSKINDLKKKLKNLENEKTHSALERENVKILLQSIDRFHDRFDDADIFERRKLVQAIVSRIVWNGHDLNIYLR